MISKLKKLRLKQWVIIVTIGILSIVGLWRLWFSIKAIRAYRQIEPNIRKEINKMVPVKHGNNGNAKKTNCIRVIVCSKDIPKGSVLNKKTLGVRVLEECDLPNGYVLPRNVDSIINRKTIVSLVPGEPISTNKLEQRESNETIEDAGEPGEALKLKDKQHSES